MGKSGKKNGKFGKHAFILSFLLTVAIVSACIFVFFKLGNKNSDDAQAVDVLGQNAENENIDFTEVSTLEMRGMWIATASNINYPSKAGLSKSELEDELEEIVKNAYNLGINSIFFQVRPACDALYNSELFPASRYVSSVEGETVDGFDSLRYLLDYAKKYNIDVHAWINPYRVTMNEKELESLADTSFASLHPEYTVSYADGKTYLNPGIPEVRKFVVDGVREIVERYPDISGIHFDDYFYPYPVGDAEFDDEEQFLLYSDGKSLDDWRRENVNLLVKETYDAVKEINPECDFGVSVFGIWANKGSDTPIEGSETKGLEAYFSTYCDALSWANDGYVDYIAPQIYWSFDTTVAPFDDLARWWNANLDGTGVDLYIGHAAYKSSDYDEGEIYKQVEMARTLSSYKGSIFYGYENICDNVGNIADDIKSLYAEKRNREDIKSDGSDIEISFPDNNSYTNTSKTYVLGSCDPAFPLYVNGNAVSKTKGGYFGLYLDLVEGKNTLVFSQNGKETTHIINRGTETVYKTDNSLEKMSVSNVYPSGLTWLCDGESINVSCVAPAGSVVFASLAGTEVALSPTLFLEGEGGEYIYEKYVGELTVPSLLENTSTKLLGNVEFSAILDGKSASATGGEIRQNSDDLFVYAEVKNDYTHTKVGTSSSFYDDFLPSSKGMRDYVVSASNGYCKMRFGGYIKEENLEFTYGKPLQLNTILSVVVDVDVADTYNNKQNSTDIRFSVTENIPVDVDFNGPNGEMRIIIYNTDTSIIPNVEVKANPLVKSVVGKTGTRENMLMYYVTLKEKTNFYGFNIVYEDGCMIVKLNNPQTLSDGNKPLLGKTIVVDAGHGGTDIGAPGSGSSPEKVLNQNIASKLAEKLRALGANVVESREDDTTVDLYARMDILNDICPDLAISIHHNSVATSANALKARGFVALYSNSSGISLADTVADVVCDTLSRDKKPTAYQQLAVARNHRFPSALLEMCFISNVEEYEWSITNGNDEKSAQAILDGILTYYRNQEKYLDY